ncbi:MAG: hypothetical protein IPP33_03880 [Flavobacteriales bacterium]|nr:hypothetical protein [Flavobacteriales bacterium]
MKQLSDKKAALASPEHEYGQYWQFGSALGCAVTLVKWVNSTLGSQRHPASAPTNSANGDPMDKRQLMGDSVPRSPTLTM